MELDTIVKLEKRAIEIERDFYNRVVDYKEIAENNEDYITFLKKRYRESNIRFRELGTISEMLCDGDIFAMDRLNCTIYEHRLSVRQTFKDFMILLSD